MQQVVASKQETRNGILWDVIPAQKLCRVKIQGSNEYVYAYYPENWEKTPVWLKSGNAVRIMHTGGIRGRIEIVGHGQVIPTPIIGDTFPPPSISGNAILTGCNLMEALTPRMVVLVGVGTYRINQVYTLGPITMGNGTNYLASDGGAMGAIAGAIPINAAPSAGNYRYDLIYVGANGVIMYLAGDPSPSPVEPTLPLGYVQLVPYILVPSGTTEIRNGINIGGTYSPPIPASLVMVITDNDLDWDELTTEVTVAVYDQYGFFIGGTGYGWYFTLEIIDGNGKVSSPEEGESTTKIGGHTGSESSYVFTYTRNHLDPGDESPVLQAKLGGGNISFTGYIILRDVDGNPM